MASGGVQTSNNGGNQAASNVPANRFSSLDVTGRSSIEDASNPYFLSNSDHPNLNLVTTALVGDNYNS